MFSKAVRNFFFDAKHGYGVPAYPYRYPAIRHHWLRKFACALIGHRRTLHEEEGLMVDSCTRCDLTWDAWVKVSD